MLTTRLSTVILAALLVCASCSHEEETAPEVKESLRDMAVAEALKDFDEGRMNAALGKIEAVLEEHPDDLGAMRVKSMVLASLDRTDEAASVLEKLAEREPNDLDVQHILGTIYYKQKLWDKAVRHLEKSLKAPNRAQEARELLVLCCEKLHQPEKAISLLEEMLKEHPEDSIILTRLGELQFSQEKYGHAEKSFRKAIKIDPKLLPAYEGLAASQAMLERYEDTEKTLLAAVRELPREPGPRARLAETYLQLGRPLDALTVIEQLKGITGESRRITQLRNAAEAMLKAQGKPVPPR
jgi:tetratricopeptide (TPR) repeat protein